ncbi:hypothetical protein ACQZ5N_03195 [Agrobacterium sp. 22-221-1]
MTDEQYKALRQLMLEQNSKIAELTLEVRRLSEAVTTTEVVYVEENRVGTEQLEELLRIRQSPAPHSDNE